MHQFLVRPLCAEEWARAREFRLEALRDQVAPVAYLTTFDEAAGWADDVWQERALAGSQSAGPGARQRTLIAVDHDSWLGTLTVLVTEVGEKSYAGKVLTTRTADVVGVYVAPGGAGHRSDPGSARRGQGVDRSSRHLAAPTLRTRRQSASPASVREVWIRIRR
jgi:hypothetical protein